MPPRLGLLGGTFDPVHLGHVAAGRAAQHALSLDEVRLVPARIPPHRTVGPRAPGHHRLAMASIAAHDEPGWTVSETELRREGPSFTFDTLMELHRAGWAPEQIFFITGTDAFAEVATWSRYPAVLDLSHFIVVTRPGTARADVETSVPALTARVCPAADIERARGTCIVVVEAATPAVSSTDVRARAAEGASLAGLVPAAVERYIRRHGLYESGSSVEGALHGEDQ